MNIFYLDRDPHIAARMLCDQHVVKMILETCQMLCTAHHVLDGPNEWGYKPTHINHPSTVWARTTNNNYNWLYCHLQGMAQEYTRRYRRQHESWIKMNDLVRTPPLNIPIGPLTQPPQCMPAMYKQPDAMYAYRLYYALDKSEFARYKDPRTKPQWLQDMQNVYADMMEPAR